MNKKYVYIATYEDLTHLGGTMGTEYTVTKFLGVYSSPDTAKTGCNSHYNKKMVGKINWIRDGNGLRSPDLGFIIYYIKKYEVK